MKVPQTDFKLILFHLPNITIVIHDICEHLKKYLQNQMWYNKDRISWYSPWSHDLKLIISVIMAVNLGRLSLEKSIQYKCINFSSEGFLNAIFVQCCFFFSVYFYFISSFCFLCFSLFRLIIQRSPVVVSKFSVSSVIRSKLCPIFGSILVQMFVQFSARIAAAHTKRLYIGNIVCIPIVG